MPRKKREPWKKGISKKLLDKVEKLELDKIEFSVLDGYYTYCTIEKGGEFASGTAICSSIDKFDESIGRNKSLGRAIKALTKKEQTERVRKTFHMLPKTWTIRQALRVINSPNHFKCYYANLQS